MFSETKTASSPESSSSEALYYRDGMSNRDWSGIAAIRIWAPLEKA